ncbi:MAG: pyridoxal 5'-phosphate synthase glutaminase subunit PdxT [Myxococcota bacterium]|nr:pyridoxal 5'-phosphate synthase glutaminase subunit PdxT [Myxococcota bacterium]
MKSVGILAVQGGYAVHADCLRACGATVRLVRTSEDLKSVDGLILPGGESTAQLRLINRFHLEDELDAFVARGRPVLATCAGLILAAQTVSGPTQASFGWLDCDVRRNGWGRQVDSFEAVADPSSTNGHLGEAPLPMMFIRAPRITRIGADVEVLARYQSEPVLVRQGPFWGATFHPELTVDQRIHRLAFGL